MPLHSSPVWWNDRSQSTPNQKSWFSSPSPRVCSGYLLQSSQKLQDFIAQSDSQSDCNLQPSRATAEVPTSALSSPLDLPFSSSNNASLDTYFSQLVETSLFSPSSFTSSTSLSTSELSSSSMSSLPFGLSPQELTSAHAPPFQVRFANNNACNHAILRNQTLSRKGSLSNLRKRHQVNGACQVKDSTFCLSANRARERSADAQKFLNTDMSDRFPAFSAVPHTPTRIPPLSATSSSASSVNSESASWLLDASPESDIDDETRLSLDSRADTPESWFLHEDQSSENRFRSDSQSTVGPGQTFPSWREKLTALKDRLEMLDNSVFFDDEDPISTQQYSLPHRTNLRCHKPAFSSSINGRSRRRKACFLRVHCCHCHCHCQCCFNSSPCSGHSCLAYPFLQPVSSTSSQTRAHSTSKRGSVFQERSRPSKAVPEPDPPHLNAARRAKRPPASATAASIPISCSPRRNSQPHLLPEQPARRLSMVVPSSTPNAMASRSIDIFAAAAKFRDKSSIGEHNGRAEPGALKMSITPHNPLPINLGPLLEPFRITSRKLRQRVKSIDGLGDCGLSRIAS